jgi:hypothetical protein
LFLVLYSGARRRPRKRVNVREILEGENNIDQQSWPMCEAISRN